MVSQAELIFKGCHCLVPRLISVFRDSMGPFKNGPPLIYEKLIETDIPQQHLSLVKTS